MADVLDFKVSLPSIDGEVDAAFKGRIKRGLDADEDGASFLNIMNAYILWTYREDWRNGE